MYKITDEKTNHFYTFFFYSIWKKIRMEDKLNNGFDKHLQNTHTLNRYVGKCDMK